jgi:tetratricopeptide (TPR) repeat protein
VLQERQQTLRALVDWSYELLKENEQTVLNRLGVFPGGFDLAAAEEVCGAEPIDSLDVLDILQSLVEKSLVMLDDSGESSRYRMLDTICDYAIEKLEHSGEKDAIAVRHCQHYFSLAKQIRDGIQGAEQSEWVGRGEAEIDNLRAAINLSLSGGTDVFIAVKMCVALQNFWILRGYVSEGREFVRGALALPQVQASEMAQSFALYAGAVLAEVQSDHAQARQMLETCLELKRGIGNPVDVALTLSELSSTRLKGGDMIGASAAENEALELFRRVGHRIGEMIALLHLGEIELYAGNDGQAREFVDQGLAIARSLKHQEGEAAAELLLGHAAFEAGDQPRALARLQRSLAVSQASGDKRGEATAVWWLGRLELRAGQFEGARQKLGDALRAFRDFEMRTELLSCLEDHASLAGALGSSVRAVQLASAASTMRARRSLPRAPRDEQRWQAECESLRQGLSPEAHAAAMIEGEMWDLESAMSSALAAH